MVFLSTDHPRGCGEHDLTLCRPDFELGSSPRMRGAPTVEVMIAENDGIIPADAGSTSKTMSTRPDAGDHPRGCGEHGCTNCSNWLFQGSSPRMRGALAGINKRFGLLWIIPADAGSTAYPRICRS